MMVASIFDFEARRRAAVNAKRVSGPLRSNRVLRWGCNLSKNFGILRTVESATMALGLPLRLDKRLF